MVIGLVVTMKDVADYAGVSKSTVSQFLNKRYNFMSAQTKEKIAQAIDSLEYQPNQLARSLKQKKTNLVAIVASNLSSRFTTELVSVIEKRMNTFGIDVIVAASEDNPEKEKKYVESLIAKQVDGFLIFPTIENKDLYQQLAKRNYPIVFLDRVLEQVPISSVLLDNRLAIEESVQHLIDQNIKKIAILTFPVGVTNSITPRIERIEGYRSGLNKNQIQINQKYIQSDLPENMPRLLDQLFKMDDKPEAIVATNDILLEIVLTWVKENHVKIPQELSIIGIDDVSFAKFYQPAISTIEQPIEEMGMAAADILLEQMKGQSDGHYHIKRFKGLFHNRESIKSSRTKK